MTGAPRWRASPRAIHTRTPRGGVVLDPVSKAYFALNASAEVIWRILETGATAQELADALCREFEVSSEIARADVAACIAELEANALVHVDAAR